MPSSGRTGVLVERFGLVLIDPDPAQVERDVVVEGGSRAACPQPGAPEKDRAAPTATGRRCGRISPAG